MKKLIAQLLLITMLLSLLAGCGGNSGAESQPTESTAPSINQPTESTAPTTEEDPTTGADTTPSEEEMNQLLDAHVDSLMASLENVMDTSVIQRKTQPISFSPTTEGSGARECFLTVSSGASAIHSVKINQREFAGSALITVSQLISEGWSCDKLDSTIKPSFAGLMVCQTPDGKNVIVKGLNPTDKDLAFRDCVVSGVNAEYDELHFSATSAAQLQINGAQISRTTSLTKFIEQVGCPNKIYIEDRFSNWSYQSSRIQLIYQIKGITLTVDFLLSNETATLQGILYDFA